MGGHATCEGVESRFKLGCIRQGSIMWAHKLFGDVALEGACATCGEGIH